MKSLSAIGLVVFFTFLSSCNSCSDEDERKYDVMQRYGGWQARMDETRSVVKHIEAHHREYDMYILDSSELANFNTEYPYWGEVRLHSYENELKRAVLISQAEKESRWEKLYFKGGKLIYGSRYFGEKSKSSEPSEEYFFEQKTLVFALDENGGKRDITDEVVLLSGIDFVKEAEQIQGIIASNKSGN